MRRRYLKSYLKLKKEQIPDRVIIAEKSPFERLDCAFEDFRSTENEKVSKQSLEYLEWAEVLELEEFLVQQIQGSLCIHVCVWEDVIIAEESIGRWEVGGTGVLRSCNLTGDVSLITFPWIKE